MIRKFNYTGRKKIMRSQVSITLNLVDHDPPSFDAEFNFDGLGLPLNGNIFVEAYHGPQYMRFPFGTVGNIQPPNNRQITDIDPIENVLFRVKVVDNSEKYGRLLAAANMIKPCEPHETSSAKRSLLPVKPVDLDETVWRITFEERPILQVNKRIDDIMGIVRSDYQFISLVFPAVLREILRQIIVKEGYDEDDEGWHNDWIRFANNLPGISSPPPSEEDEEDQLAWIEDAVDAFCSHYKTSKKFTHGHKTEEI